MEAAAGFEEFVTIVECGSVTAAADHLALPRPTISRRLARLEERLGVRLLHRTTRRLKLTREGEVFFAKARTVVTSTHEAQAAVRRMDGVPRGLLRLSTPPGLPPTFAKWMARYQARYPEVELEVVGSNLHVDLVAESFDLALRRGLIEDNSLIARVVVVDPTIGVASAKYLARHGTPERPEDLADHACIVGYQSSGRPEQYWPLFDGGRVAVSGRLRTNQMELRVEAARADQGIALASNYWVGRSLQSGELRPVLPGVLGANERVSLVYADREYLDPKIRSFVDFFLQQVEDRKTSTSRPQQT